VELTLQLAGGANGVKAGDKPTLEIVANNTSDKAVTVTVDLQMTAVAPSDRMSRMMPMPTEVWKDRRPLELQPHQSVVVDIPTGTAVPADKSVAVVMTCDKNRVNLPLVTAEPKPRAPKAAVAKAKPSKVAVAQAKQSE
jgi:hypothetical protein